MYLIVNNKDRVDINQFVFSGGEVSVSVPTVWLMASHDWRIVAKLKSSEDVMTLAMLADVLQRSSPKSLELYMPYIPYARQDRVCNFGEAFSLKVFCTMINNMKFDRVVVEDPHSEVAPALLDNVVIYDQATCIRMAQGNRSLANFISSATLVSPDAGAEKKILSVCKAFDKGGFISASKVREPSTGKIIATAVNAEKLGGNYLIVDDICDGGATFIALAKELKIKGADKVGLYVTHGIFSRGKQHLLDNGIDYVYSLNDWTTEEVGKYEY